MSTMEETGTFQKLLAVAKDGDVESINNYLSQTGSDINSTDSNMKTALILAIEDGHDGAVQSLIGAGIDVNRKCVAGNTALMCCARLGHISYLRMLIEAGSLIDESNNDGDTALMFAARGQARRDTTIGSSVYIAHKEGKIDLTLLREIDFKQFECAKVLLRFSRDVNKQNTSGWTALMMASAQDRPDLLRALIHAGVRVDLHDNIMETALMVAAGNGLLSCVRELIQAGASVDAVDIYGQTALMYACFSDSLSCVQELILAGAKVELNFSASSAPERNKDTVLIHAVRSVNSKIVTAVLSAGAEINATNIHGDTALIVAVKEEKYLCLKTLVDAGADVNLQNKNGQTALMIASSKTCTFCFIILIDKSNDLNICDNDGRTALMYSSWSDFTSCLLNYGANINHTDNKGNTALMECCRVGNVHILNILIQHGADINLANVEGQTALMFATQYVFTYLLPQEANANSARKLYLTLKDCDDCEDFVYRTGRWVNLTSEDGTTTLMSGAKMKPTNSLTKLIESGADINSVDSEGRNALYFAVKYERTYGLSILLSAGGDVQWRDSAGRTLLMHAMIPCVLATPKPFKYHPAMEFTEGTDSIIGCVKLLLKAGVDVNAQDIDGRTALMFASDKLCVSKRLPLLIAAGADANLTDKDGRTALMIAARIYSCSRNCTSEDDRPDRSDSIVRQLISVTDDIDRQDNSKNTALLIATANQRVIFAFRLVESGANVNVRDLTGMTPLLHATKLIYNDDFDIAGLTGLLIEKGADVNAQDIDGMTPLMYAARDQYVEICEQLLSNGANVEQTDNKGRTALMHLIIAAEGRYVNKLVLLDILENTSNFLLEKEFRPLLQTILPFGVSDIVDHPIIAHFYIRNGVTDFSQMQGWKDAGYSYASSLFAASLTIEQHMFLHKFILVTCILFQSDFKLLHNYHFSYHMISHQGKDFLQEALSNPWPLVKLCFIVVSSKVGVSHEREERIRQTGLPLNIQKCLLFQRPIAELPVHHWQDIPLTFNPTEYERLPAPYPLLYNWPFGRRLVTCYCSKCNGRGLNFEVF